MVEDELKYPKELENNDFIKKLFEKFIETSKEVRNLKDSRNSLELKVAGMKMILEKNAGIKVIENEHGMKFEYPKGQEGEREEIQTQQKPRRIMGHHDFVRLDQDNNMCCSVCEHRLNSNERMPQKATL